MDKNRLEVQTTEEQTTLPVINSILKGDCAEVMKQLPDNSIPLTVTSPPYEAFDENWQIVDQLRKYSKEGYSWSFPEVAKQLYRVTKEGGYVVWIVGDKIIDGKNGKGRTESGTPLREALYFMQLGFNLDDTIPYVKDPRYSEKKRYPQSWEYIFVLCKGESKTFNQIKDYKTKSWLKYRSNHAGNRNEDGEVNYRPYTVNQVGARCNVWYYDVGFLKSTKDEIAYKHPAIFPDALAEDCIKSWSNEGDIILDCFAGSGTTLKAAQKLGRKYIGIEISEEYIEIAKKRLSTLENQARLI